jgi:hypothetical protein
MHIRVENPEHALHVAGKRTSFYDVAYVGAEDWRDNPVPLIRFYLL